MTATYRLQLHAGFTFADAASVVPYLSELGVTHLYLSPVLQAVPGSMHGYDVLDHTRVSRELGGAEGLRSLAATAREHGLGLVVDVVPNHMALVAPEDANVPLWDVLAHGRAADHAHWFDVDWDALDQRLGLPLLGAPLAEVVAAGELTLDVAGGRQLVRYYDHVLPVADGTWDGDPDADVSVVLSRQHYLLASWRERDEVLNYRRFFDVDSLIAVRVEDPDVFEATHRVLLGLNHEGVIEGLRIDHPDGLADPTGYLERLRAALRPGTGLWVEKILEGDEALPPWACDGTTGYDAAKAVSAALVDGATATALQETWVDLGGDPSLEHTIEESKRLVVDEVLVPERRRLVRRAREALPEADPARLEEAVAELLVACSVYRAYVRPGRPTEDTARRVMREALEVAVDRRPDLKSELQQLVDVALEPSTPPARDLAVRLQQTWGPVMAKGIEDTAFYRWHRLVALNEVGGDPGLLDDGQHLPERLHRWAAHQQRHWPLGMSTLSTHDTKRSEDVRARLLAVAGDAESWQRCSDAFAQAARERRVDAPTAHLLWQTLAGVGDIDEERLGGYLTKAMRESKQHTSWLEPDQDYESAVLALAAEARRPGGPGALVRSAVDRNERAVRAVVLGQKLLQLTMPGTPDIYQGCEVVDLSLVDPDNRRPVDFGARRARLEHLRTGAPRDLDDEKLLVTHRTLRLRRALPASFGDNGGYEPLTATSRHLVGFVRGGEVASLVTRAPARLDADGGWGRATVRLPEGLWRDELSGVSHGGGDTLCAEVLDAYPVALLRRRHRA
ncbi:MAG TPA: malto-oligosyltrehalose synthase [Nocardioidaceae bacterium]|nr:malto-oligosyltrehalose synthase [Nocardioidaceae bacterium]